MYLPIHIILLEIKRNSIIYAKKKYIECDAFFKKSLLFVKLLFLNAPKG